MLQQLLAFILLCEFTTIRLSDETIRVELAQTHKEQVKGLKGRTELAENEGMLFVYETPQILPFWMKGVKIPLSIGFFDEKRELIGVKEMALSPIKIYYSPNLAQYALEMPAGWFERHNIPTGTRFEWDEHSR